MKLKAYLDVLLPSFPILTKMWLGRLRFDMIGFYLLIKICKREMHIVIH